MCDHGEQFTASAVPQLSRIVSLMSEWMRGTCRKQAPMANAHLYESGLRRSSEQTSAIRLGQDNHFVAADGKGQSDVVPDLVFLESVVSANDELRTAGPGHIAQRARRESAR